MTKSRKALAAAIVLAMLTSSLAACGQKSESSSTDSGEQSSSTSTSSNAIAEPQVHTLKVLGPDPNNTYIKYSEREEYEVWGALQDMLAANDLELELEVVPNDQYQVVIQTRMASSDLPDISNVSAIDDASLISLGKNGTIQEISGAIAEYSNGNIDRMYSEVYDTGYPLIKTAEGQIYWLTNLHKGNTFEGQEVPMGLGLQIRYDWLQKLGMEMPTTLDEFTEAIRAFRANDVNGNGQQDEIILLDAQYFNNGMAQIFGLGNGIVALNPVDGKIVSPWYQENIKEYFTYVKSLIDEGLIDASTIGSWDLQNLRLADNLVGSWFAYDSATYLNTYVTNGAEGVDYEPVFTLTDAVEGSEPWKELETPQLVWDRYCVTKACTDMEGAIKLFDMIYSDEYTAILSWGIEGKDYEEVDGVRTSLIGGLSNEEKAQARRSTGSPLWGGILPRVQIGTAFNTEAEWRERLSSEKKTDIQIEALSRGVTYENWYPLMISNFLAMATDEETETINQLQTAIETYSDEMCLKLALGTESLDNFDTIFAEFEELGLKELIAIYQARCDCFVASQG